MKNKNETNNGWGTGVIVILTAIAAICCAFQNSRGLGLVALAVCAVVLAALHIYGQRLDDAEAPGFVETEEPNGIDGEESHFTRIGRILRTKRRNRQQVKLLLNGGQHTWLHGHIIDLEFGRVVVRTSEGTTVAVWRDILDVA